MSKSTFDWTRSGIQLSAKLESALSLAFPDLAGNQERLAMQIRHIGMSACLLVGASEDELIAAVQDYTFSWQRIKELRQAPETTEAKQEIDCLVHFQADRRASGLFLKSKRGERISITDAAYLNRMRKRKALYGVSHHPMESPRPATAAELAECERTVRQCCKLPDDLPDDRLILVLEDFSDIAQDSFHGTDDEERNSRGMSGEAKARLRAVRCIKGDAYAVDLYSKRFQGTALTDEENAYLDSELSRK